MLYFEFAQDRLAEAHEHSRWNQCHCPYSPLNQDCRLTENAINAAGSRLDLSSPISPFS